MREPPQGNEDVGRYVGYGYKTFNKPKGIFNLGYFLLKTIYSKDMTCYGRNEEAKVLCENKYAVDVFHVPTMRMLFDQMDPESEPYMLMQEAFDELVERGLADDDQTIPAVMR